jgi:hypothetical protein
MTLDDVDPRIFGFFVHWLYTQELCPKGEAFILMDLTRFYRLADRFMVHPLQNDLRLRITCFVPSQDPGNTLKDFQLLAYGIDGDNWLKEQSIKLVREAMIGESESPNKLDWWYDSWDGGGLCEGDFGGIDQEHEAVEALAIGKLIQRYYRDGAM